MSVDSYKELLAHAGHAIKCVTYGEPDSPANVAIECLTCGCVLVDYERPRRFVVVAKFRDNPAGDYIGLVPISLPPDDLFLTYENGPAKAQSSTNCCRSMIIIALPAAYKANRIQQLRSAGNG